MSLVNVKDGYPEKLSDKEIREEINKMRQYANGGGWKWEMIIAANSMIQSGQGELNDRFTKKTFYTMLILTSFSLLFAATAIIFSFRTDKTDLEWKDNEIKLLNKIEKNTSK